MFRLQDSLKLITKNMENKFSIQKAFTLVEVIVAIGVLTIGVLGIATFFAFSTRIARSASNTSIASNLAQGVLDEQTAKSYEELTSVARTDYTSDTSSPLNKFQKQIDVSLVDSNLAVSETDIGIKEITVHIYYDESGSEKSVEIATIKAKR